MIVIEVDEAVLPGRPELGKPARPGGQRDVTVGRPWPGATLMEAEIRPVRRPPDRAEDAAPIGQAQSGAVILEQRPDVVREPALVAELDSDPELRREPLEGAGQALAVGLELRRQLDQDRAELRSQAADPRHEALDGLSRV